MPNTRQLQPSRELTWDSLDSRDSTPCSSQPVDSYPLSESVPSLGWSSSSPLLSSPFAARPAIAGPHRFHSPASQDSGLGAARKQANIAIRELTFDSIASEPEAISIPSPNILQPQVELLSPIRLNETMNTVVSARAVSLPKRTSLSTARPPSNQTSWRHVSSQFSQQSSSPVASSEADDSSDVDVESVATSGGLGMPLEDVEQLRLDLGDSDEADDEPVLVHGVGLKSLIPDVGPNVDTDEEISGVDNGSAHNEDLTIPSWSLSKPSYAPNPKGTLKIDTQAGGTEFTGLLPETLPLKYKRIEPGSPVTPPPVTPIRKRARLVMSVELPRSRSSRATPHRRLPTPHSQSRNSALKKKKAPHVSCDSGPDVTAPVNFTVSDVSLGPLAETCPDEEMLTAPLHNNTSQIDTIEIGSDMSCDDDEEWTVATGAHSSDSLAPLRNCMENWAIGCDWDADDERNPVQDLIVQPLMGVSVMDHTVGYLVYHSILMETVSGRSVCLIPPSLFGALKQIERVAGTEGSAGLASRTAEDLSRLRAQRDMVWTKPQPPSRIIVPVIDHQSMHCYLWYGEVKPKQGCSAFHCELKYLDPLARPSAQTFAERFRLAKTIVQILLPQINGEIISSYEQVEGYRQTPGSLDCGYFVCQAVSALSFHCDNALRTLQPVPLVKSTIRRILESCADRALQRLSVGSVAKKPILLHVPRQVAPLPGLGSTIFRPKTPPIRKELPAWESPQYSRSLSEPHESYKTLRSGSSTSMSWGEVFGPMPAPSFGLVDPESAGLYLERLRDRNFRMPSGMLNGVASSLPDHFMESLLLSTGNTSNVRWLPGVTVVGGDRDDEELERPEDCVGVRTMCEALQYLREGEERSVAVLTGTNAGHQLRMDWRRDALDLEEDWLSASLDVDSLSLTAEDPQFTLPAVLHAYPDRASTLTTNNGLSVLVNGKKTSLSHIPNFTFLTIGQNNQFRVNIFFPQYEKGTDAAGHYITILDQDDFKSWYELIILPALRRVSWSRPLALQETCRRLIMELPKSYKAAEAHCLIGGGRTFTGYKVMPEILNLLLREAKAVVDDSPSLAKFGDFFYHICGINLKAVCEAIPQRSNGNPMLHVLQQYPIVDWSLQNYCDIAVDIGLEVSICREKLPIDIDDVTLIWKLDALKRLYASSWQKPNIDPYVHSHVVGGLSSKPRAHVSPWFYGNHAYMKDKVNTYRHRDSSIGTGFSPDHGTQGAAQYQTHVTRLQDVWADGRGSYGVRVEWRAGLRTANEILQLDPDLWRRRFLSSEAIIALRTADVVRLKSLLLHSYKWFFSRMQQLPAQDRKSLPVGLLGSVLTYLVHGLVSRPDDMSSSRGMVKDLQVASRAKRFGLATIPPERLASDLCRMTGEVTVNSYPILKYLARKNPSGVRMKHSTLGVEENSNPEGVEVSNRAAGPWSSVDQQWVERVVNTVFAEWLWSCLPLPDQRVDRARNAHSGPYLFSKWQHAVGTGVQHGQRTTPAGFDGVCKKLFPENWVHRETGANWSMLQTVVLDPIIQRIETVSIDQQAAYSGRIRQALTAVLMRWEFLPAVQKKYIWSYEGSGRCRIYKLYKNPRPVRA